MKRNTILAAALAGLALGAAGAADKKSDPGQCYGVNGCKGKGECATKTHACAGLNACKGKGWVKTTAATCKKKKGKFIAGLPM